MATPKNTAEEAAKKAAEEAAREARERMEKENAGKERAEAAKQALQAQKIEDVDIMGEEAGLVVDEQTGEMVTPNELRQKHDERNAQLNEKEKKEGEVPVGQMGNQTDKLHRSGVELESSNNQGATQTFNTLAKSKQWRKQVSEVLRNKWSDSPRNLVELEKFLRDKNVEVDAIGTSDVAVQAWLRTIIDCR